MSSKLLTKSKYIAGIQCLKYLWIQINEPERIPATGVVKQHMFDQGNLVGKLAKKLFPGGIDVPTDDFMGNIRQTKKIIDPKQWWSGLMLKDGFYETNPFSVLLRHIPMDCCLW